MARDGSLRPDWAGLPLIATVARLLCRELTLKNEYLRLENRILRSRIQGRIRFTDDGRWSLMRSALAMGRKLMRKVVIIVKPDPILAWQRRLEQRTWDYLAEVAYSPHAGWMAQQVRNTLMVCDDLGIRPRFLIHDRDRCFAEDFDGVLRSAGVKPVPTPYHAPNANAYAERRPHQGTGNRLPAHLHAGEVIPATTDSLVGEVECEEFLGGLLKSYHRAAA